MASEILTYFTSPYSSYSTLFIILETIAVLFGIISVWFAKKENILVFPTGLLSTTIFVYLLFKWGLLGDMIINTYYTIMSIYGWYIWSRVTEDSTHTPITRMTRNDFKISMYIFSISFISILIIYKFKLYINSGFDSKFISQIHQYIPTDFVDAFTTGTAFVAMWLMAKKKFENWHFWIITNIISIPLYFFFKNHGITGLQYIVFLCFAILGYRDWKKKLSKMTITI